VTDAYRLYDADMPEYAAAIDLYAGQIHLQEYAAPKTIPEADAKRRFSEVIQAVCEVFETSPDRLAIKVRERHKGQSQYEKHRADAPDIQVREGRARFYVNLHQYLDTGLFLDHRPLRLRLAEEMAGKRFLNLFCYTATATCQAILGGARASVSVDMSRTYLSWASRNFELNRIHSADHELIQADCLTYLEHCRDSFDVILLDPPSFSNSKRLEQDWDVQRDHVAVVDRCMSLLRPGGCLYFSNNLQSFRLDSGLLQRYRVEDLSAATRDRDFERNPKIHQCYRLQALAV
jgi:23S rRNA (guanine2445-N2)-methyltransferase / 23S rRNA (guanine2069-N7)-methyltransferase